MGPEQATTISPANLAAARTRFSIARDRFALEYARGQNMLSPLIRLFTRRPDRAREEAGVLRDSMLQLAEFEGRSSVTSGTLNGFRAEVALGSARSFNESQDDVARAAAESVQAPGLWTAASRAWIAPEGDAAKLLVSIGLVAAHFGGLGYGESRDIIAHAAVASSTIAAIDVLRRTYLDTTTRIVGALPDRIAQVIRRKTSIDEGIITGDFVPNLINPRPEVILSGELEDRAEDSVREQLQASDIQRPPLTRFDRDYTDRIRSVIRGALSPFDQSDELIRSRDIAATSRLVRTVLASSIILGTAAHYYITRQPTPEVYAGNCPIIQFPDPNLHTEQSIGLRNTAHLSGMAKEVFFFNAHGRSFDHSERDKKLLEDLINQDRDGNTRIINSIARTLRTQNPQLRMIDTDTFKTRLPNGEEVLMTGICDERQLQGIYRSAIESLEAERP